MSEDKFILYRDDKIFVSLKQKGYKREENHKYVLFSDKSPTGNVSLAASIVTQQYFDPVKKQTLKAWKKDHNKYVISWPHQKTGQDIKSLEFNYLSIAEELRTKSKFDHGKFNLYPISCEWLDSTLDISQNFHFFDEGKINPLLINDGTPEKIYGKDFPIKPKLDREGHIFTTFQPSLIKRIIRQRKELIENSDQALYSNWVLDLRSLINDTISLVDINLNQLYCKAEYAPEKDWSFDRDKLGTKVNRRLKDKLKWVRQISGNPFDIEKEVKKLDELRELRNHMNHFDPPTLVITIEEAVEWLNNILFIGNLLIKFRQALGTQVNILLIELICQKTAIFNPEPAFAKRLPLKNAGYKSSIWPIE